MSRARMIIKINFRLDCIIFFLIGLNAAFHIFREAFPILKYSYLFLTLFLCLKTAYKIFSNRFSTAPFYLKMIALFFAAMTSALWGEFYFNYTIEAVANIAILYFIRLGRPEKREYESFVLGYKISILIDFIYAGIQGVFFLRGQYINDILFSALKMSEHISHASMRLTGMIWDPYVIGMFCATGFFLFSNRYLKAYIVIILIFSQSRAGLVAFLASCVYFYSPKLKKRKYVLQITVVGVILLVLMMIFVDLSRGLSANSNGYVRIEYYKYIWKIMTSSGNPFLFLFGGMPASSLGPFANSGMSIFMPKSLSTAMMECDWAGIVYGQGFFGLFAYVLLFVHCFRNQRDRVFKSLMLAVAFGGVGYFYDSAIYAGMLVYLPCYTFLEPKNDVYKELRNEKIGGSL